VGEAGFAAQPTTEHGEGPSSLISARDPLPLRLCAFAFISFAFISSKSRWPWGCQEDSNGAQNAAAASLAPRMHCGMPTPSYALPTNPKPGSLALNSRILLTRSTCPTWY
jgi:hypothetical protein